VPLEAYTQKFINMRFEPSGMTSDPDIRFASSLVDYIFRRLALQYLPEDKRAGLGVKSISERKAELGHAETAETTEVAEVADPGPSGPREIELSPPAKDEVDDRPAARILDAPLCYACGSKMQPAGSCYVCSSCGATSGCS
jgi:ribonucleoside-diphosphate reductase alpha chain